MPAAQSLLTKTEISILIMDEEKGQENTQGKSFSPMEEHLIPDALWYFDAVAGTKGTPPGGTLPDPIRKHLTPPPDFV